MKRSKMTLLLGFLCLFALALDLSAAQNPQAQAPGDRPNLPGHVSQDDINAGRLSLDDLIDAGRFLFATPFNILDGFGRPAATGNNVVPTKRVAGPAPFMTRVSGPETNSCAGCHNRPEPGGAGDFVNNIFLGANLLDPVSDSISADVSDERHTIGMHGSGAIEMLAREMTADLLDIQSAAIQQAAASGVPVTLRLITKDIDFGFITGRPDGTVDTSRVEGVSSDLRLRPFHQDGLVVSLRVFTVNAFNHHHGMQAVERFGRARTGEDDFDEDGVKDELSVGDITAATLFQASLQVPGRAIPVDPQGRRSVERGELLFDQIHCASCHRPALTLNNPVFSEPNPFNAPSLSPPGITRPFTFDLTREGPKPRLETLPGGGVVVRAYTDLKRHVISDASDPFFSNERVVLPPTNVPTNQFLTRKLWDCGSAAGFGHRGDLTTVSEAILHHAGEAKPSRDLFVALPVTDKAAVIDFLKSLQVLPAGSPPVAFVGNRVPRAFRPKGGGDPDR
jgi:hypothetical protein